MWDRRDEASVRAYRAGGVMCILFCYVGRIRFEGGLGLGYQLSYLLNIKYSNSLTAASVPTRASLV